MYQETKIIGIMGRDPELRYTPDGKPQTSFSVATTRYTGKDTAPETTWWRVLIYGKNAETVSKMAHKGTKIFCSGRLICDTATGCPKIYQRKDGTFGASFDLVADTVKMLANFNDNGVPDGTMPQRQQQPQQAAQQAQTQPQQQSFINNDEDEIPF